MKKLMVLVLSVAVSMLFFGCTKNSEPPVNNAAVNTADAATEAQKIEVGDFALKDGVYYSADGSAVGEKTAEIILKAKKVSEAAKCTKCDFSSVTVAYEEDVVSKRELCRVDVKCGDKNTSVYFDESGNLVRYSGGLVISEGAGAYTADKVDEVLELAKGYYEALDVPQGYEVSGWQMDFGGPDWQVEFSRKIDVDGYDEAVYNYGEMVRMRISGNDASLLSVNVFNTPLKVNDTDTSAVAYEAALEASGLSESELTKKYIGCYSLRDKGYARLCWCFEAECAEDEVGHTVWKYVDLYTGELIGEESCQ